MHARIRRAAPGRLPRRARDQRSAQPARTDSGSGRGESLGLPGALQPAAPRRIRARPRPLPAPAGAPGERRLVLRQRLQPVALLHGPHLAALPARGAGLRPPARSRARRRRARAAPLRAALARLRRPHHAARGDLLLHELLEPVRRDGRLDPALRLPGPAAGRGRRDAARAAARRRRGARARDALPGVPRALRARPRAGGRLPRASRSGGFPPGRRRSEPPTPSP